MVEFLALAQQCAPAVAPQTLAAIIRTESGFNPLAIGINSGASLPKQPTTHAQAVATAKTLIAAGHNIDLGLGQINVKNLSWLGLSVEDALRPCPNIAGAARILERNYAAARPKHGTEQAALLASLSAYNTGNEQRGFANGYVGKVVSAAGAPIPATIKVPALDSSAAAALPAGLSVTAKASKAKPATPTPAAPATAVAEATAPAEPGVMVFGVPTAPQTNQRTALVF